LILARIAVLESGGGVHAQVWQRRKTFLHNEEGCPAGHLHPNELLEELAHEDAGRYLET
jgi:hypothetical protein